MDFTFLNYFIRLDTLPPQDPWASGHPMHYYYFGTYLFALIHKLGALDSAVGYNLSIATVAGFSLSSAYGLCLYLMRRWLPALCAAGAAILLSNLEVVRLIIWGQKRDFDLFWASSRLFKEPGITEYPLWAFLFADLHAHVIALPIALVLLALSLRFLQQEQEILTRSLVLHRIVCGLALGALFITNTWDFISYGFTLGCLMLMGAGLYFFRRTGGFVSRLSAAASDLIRDVPLVILGALPVLLLFNQASGSEIQPNFGFNQAFEFNSLDQVLRHLGQWLAILVVGLPALAVASRIKPGMSLVVRVLWSLTVAVIPLGFGLITMLRPFGRPAPDLDLLPWDILALCASLAFLGAFALSTRRCLRQIRVAAVFTIAGACIIAGAEICFLMDHMNTIFKFYNAVWVLLALAAVLVLPRAVLTLWNGLPAKIAWVTTRPLTLALIALLAVACAGSLFNTYTMSSTSKINGPRPTLDGMAYLLWQDLDEAAAIQWLRKNIKGVPTILEAQGPSYQNFSRITMNTGLPTVLGWEWHVQQRGTPLRAVRERADVIKAIYSAPDPETAIDYLKLLGVDLVYIGPLERMLYANGTYNRAGLKKWDEHYMLFSPVFRSGNAVIYKMPFSKLH